MDEGVELGLVRAGLLLGSEDEVVGVVRLDEDGEPERGPVDDGTLVGAVENEVAVAVVVLDGGSWVFTLEGLLEHPDRKMLQSVITARMFTWVARVMQIAPPRTRRLTSGRFGPRQRRECLPVPTVVNRRPDTCRK